MQGYKHWYYQPLTNFKKKKKKKCGIEEVSKLVLESRESDIDKESFDIMLELLIKNQKVKISCYANKIDN